MQPGRATNQPPEFPDAWCGLWQDQYGKVMYIRRISGRSLEVSFAPGLFRPFFPRPGGQGQTQNLPAVYTMDGSGNLFLCVEAGLPSVGPTYNVQFFFGEGDRLRQAEPWDLVSGVIARPRVGMGLYDDWEEDLGVSWAYPLANFWRQEEEEAKFREFHGF